MNKTKLYKLIFIIAIYSAAFTLLLISIKNYTSYLSTYKNNKTTQHTKVLSTKYIKKANCINKIQKNIAKSVLRLHVIANSDTAQDQALKLKVRNAIIEGLQSSLTDTGSVQDARSQILAQIPSVRQKAQETIVKEGYSYPVKVTLGNQYFPIKDYGDLRFPAGNYEALCVRIGAASGHNWWCVLFPSLCFVDETHAVVPADSKEKLQSSLSKEEYESLEIHSAACDWITKKLNK